MKLPVQSAGIRRTTSFYSLGFEQALAAASTQGFGVQMARFQKSVLTSVPVRGAVSRLSVFKKAAESLPIICPFLPAEFGCGCYLDGFPAPCSLVAGCLNAGLCEPA
ncbi:MAG: hypothetical protein F6J92_41495 [Symploca sp. SIO1A3]|nr:hypothetical protein [Symploca sp. SIO1A3]